MENRLTMNQKCPRCLGQKHVYKMAAAYCLVPCGGPKVDCPCCNGKGTIVPLENASDEIKQAVNELKVNSRKKKSKPESAEL